MKDKSAEKPQDQKNIGGHVTFLAAPEVLESHAASLWAAINKAQESIQEMEELLNKTSFYWQGKAAFVHRNAYWEKKQRVNQVFHHLKGSAESLCKMAGVYQAAENEAEIGVQALPEDILN